MRHYNMLKDSPGKSLFFFALPIILGNLFQQFYNMVDSIIVGQFVGEEALAAVGASYALTTVFIMIAIGGGIGASVITSQYLGANKIGKMKTSIYTALISFLIISCIFGLIGFFMNERILLFLGTPANIMEDATAYLGIYFWGLPFLFMYNILSAIFNAMGKSRTPLYLLIFSSMLNVILDLVFVCLFFWGVKGVAIATVIAQGISAVISFILLIRHLKTYETEEKVSYYEVSMLGKMVKVALPSTLQQAIVSIGMLLVQSVVNGFDSSVLAGYTAATRVESFCIVPMIATGNAVSTFTAQNLGAKQVERIKQGYKMGCAMVGTFAVILCVLLNIFHTPILSAFLNQESSAVAFATGSSFVRFISFFFVFIGLKAATDGILRGAGDVVVFTMANLINLGIRVSFAYLMVPVLGVNAVWYAIPIGWGVNFLISFIRYLSGKWCKKLLISTEEA